MNHDMHVRNDGSSTCLVCGGEYGATLPSECPGELMSSGHQACVFSGEADYVDGRWAFWPIMGMGPIAVSERPTLKYVPVGQSRLSSFVEQVLNVGSGFITAFLTWQFLVIPIWDIETTLGDNLTITALFTVISVIRGYLWRRYFNHRHCRQTVAETPCYGSMLKGQHPPKDHAV